MNRFFGKKRFVVFEKICKISARRAPRKTATEGGAKNNNH